jgi:hypothetical protein
MKFGFFKKGKLVDTCHAESKTCAKSEVDYDEFHEILDSDLLTSGTLDGNKIYAFGTKEMPIFNARS